MTSLRLRRECFSQSLLGPGRPRLSSRDEHLNSESFSSRGPNRFLQVRASMHAASRRYPSRLYPLLAALHATHTNIPGRILQARALAITSRLLPRGPCSLGPLELPSCSCNQLSPSVSPSTSSLVDENVNIRTEANSLARFLPADMDSGQPDVHKLCGLFSVLLMG